MLFGMKPGLNEFEKTRVEMKAERFGLHGDSPGMQRRSHRLEVISRRLKAGTHSLEPGEVGLEGEEQVLKGEEYSFEQPTASGMPWPEPLNLETAVEEGFMARKWPSRQGKEALWDEF